MVKAGVYKLFLQASYDLVGLKTYSNRLTLC